MKAYVANGINSQNPLSVFAFQSQYPEPSLPTATSVLVRIAYAAVNPADLQYVNGQYNYAPAHPMPRFPCPLGVDGSGVVCSVGSRVTKFKPGDPVLGLHRRMNEGTFAEIASFEEAELVHKPDSICWQLAAAVPVAGLTALSALLHHPALKDIYGDACSCKEQPVAPAKTAAAQPLPAAFRGSLPGPAAHSTEEHVAASGVVPGCGPVRTPASNGCASQNSRVLSILILGASGGVGSFAVLLAKHLFAIPVVVATCSARNATYVQQLGANVIIDYTSNDVEQAALQALRDQQQQQASSTIAACSLVPLPHCHEDHQAADQSSRDVVDDPRYDLVIDNVGGADHMAMASRLLRPASGLYVSSVPLADPAHPSLLNVMSFFVKLGCYKMLHHLFPRVHCDFAFNGAQADGDKLQALVDCLAAAADVVHSGSATHSKVKLTVFELEEAGAALAAVQSKRVVGKLVVRVSNAL